MGLWLFLALHVLSLLFCIVSTRATFRYLSKHQVTPKTRFLLFGFLRTRYVALFYLMSISALSLYSFLAVFYYSYLV